MEKKRFDGSAVYVSYFNRVYPSAVPKGSLEEKIAEYNSSVNTPVEIPLTEFLSKGAEIQDTINRCRAISDKDERQRFKRDNLGAAAISATFRTRSKNVKLEDKIKNYNALMVLDFDDEENPDALRSDLRSLPYIYYAGLSVSGKGLFAIVPLDTGDYRMHKAFFDALKDEMASLGHTIDKACSDVTRLRYVSYDPALYFNDNCEPYSLPEEPEDFAAPLEEDMPFEPMEPTGNERMRLYVEEWEKKKVPLDDYADWVAVGISLSHEGESGLEAFKRVSRFSMKYSEAETEKKFRGFVKGDYSPGLGTFFYKCHQYGVVPETVPHYEYVQFPVEVFPKRVQDIIRETNRHQNFPVDYISPCLLFVACLACGNSVVVELQRGWCEKSLMYLAVVGGRGTNKTSCFDFALAPIREKDNEEYDRYLSEKAVYDAEQLKPARERKMQPQPPMYRQYILSDFTPEVLVRQHKANPRGLIVFNDELIGFIYSFNKYRSGADEQMWTQLFAGGGVTVNRVGSDPVKINDTCIGVFGGIQPEILGSFARGKIQSGFIDRWLFAYPEKVPYPKFNDIDIDEKIAKDWNRIVKRILQLPFEDTPRIVRLSGEAKEIFKEWFDKLAEQKNCGGGTFAGLATKMDRYCGRFALGIEILKYGCRESQLLEISADSMRGAVALCYYFIACALKAHRQFYASPVDELPAIQKTIYEELPPNFETGFGLRVADRHGMPPRTFKRWLGTSLFRKVSHGYYEKKYR